MWLSLKLVRILGMEIILDIDVVDFPSGVWSRSRIYPTMMTQSPLGMLEFSCYPMPLLPKKETFHDYFPASHVGEYLEAFAAHRSFQRRTLQERIIFNTPVKHIAKDSGVWNVETSKQSYSCKKLIIATGLTSIPSPLNIPTTEFKSPIIHSRDLAAKTQLLASVNTKHVVVLGGSKSAFDAVQLLQSLGKKVTWIIRCNGQGPSLLSTPDAPWPLSNSHEIIATRLVAKMSPCIFEPLDSWTRFFHSNRLGIWLVDMVYWGVDTMWRKAAKYDRDENMKQLTPARPVFWSSDGIAVWNSPNLFNTVSNATILRDNVRSLQGHSVTLDSGHLVDCDVMITAIGWSNCYPFFNTPQAEHLGLPLLPAEANEQAALTWEALINIADEKVVDTFPRLSNVPTYPDHTPKSTPSRLYRSMVPVSSDDDHSIAFVGAIGTTQSFTVAEVQALWAAAYLGGKLQLPSEEEMKDDIALSTAWRRRRYLGDGYTFIFDQIPYTSMLLRDLGVNDLRKGGGWKEMLSPYAVRDYRGVLDEWRSGNP
jgi:dimethylaniline monooxygenase (N-oxide forming)